MNWDSSRPVPWERLIKESALYAAVVIGFFLIFMRDQPIGSMIAGVAFGMVFYLFLGFILAKLGYHRKTAAERRAEAAERSASKGSPNNSASDRDAMQSGPRPKPAPTRRTNAANRPKGRSRKRR